MSLAPGSSLGPYTITAEIGRGGMGVVYMAHDPRLDRQVAVKVLPPDLTSDDTAKRRFVREAKLASSLEHPNICTIHEIGETDDGQLYMREGACGPFSTPAWHSPAPVSTGWIDNQKRALVG